MTDKLPSFLNSSTLIYSGKRISLYKPEFSDATGTFSREIVTHPGAVVILPFLNSDEILLIQNFRQAINQTLWELPAGTLEPKETPHETALRELIEETGYKANEMKEVLRFYTTPGFSNEEMYGYIAKDLTEVGQNLDAHEEIIVTVKKFSEALMMIKKGEIRDGKTIALILYAKEFYLP